MPTSIVQKVSRTPIAFATDPLTEVVTGLVGPGGGAVYSFVGGLTAGSTSAASTNTTALQNALNAGGLVQVTQPGVYYINTTLIIGSNTQFILSPGVQIALTTASGGVINMLRTSCADAAIKGQWTNVSLTWTAGLTCSAAWTAHGRAVGDWVFVYGSALAPSTFNGLFQVVSVTDANNFVFELHKVPSASPTGQATALAANTNITVEGGLWNQNRATLGLTATLMNTHGLVLGGVAHLKVRNVQGRDCQKYVVHCCGLVDADIQNVSSDFTNSDTLKLYGPLQSVKARNIYGNCLDDIVSVQAKEPVAYIGYMYAWGDVQNVEVDGVDGISSTSCAVAYGSPNEYMGGLKFKNISGIAGSALRIAGDTSGVIDDIEIDNLTGTGTSAQFTIDSLATVNNIRMVSAKYRPANYTTPVPFFSGSATPAIGNIEFIGCNFADIGVNSGWIMTVYAAISQMTFTDCNFKSAGNLSILQVNSVIGNIAFNNCNAVNILNTVSLNTNVSGTPSVTFNNSNLNVYGLVASAFACTINLNGNRLALGANGLARSNAAVAIAVKSAGNNSISGSVLTVGSGTGLFSVYGWDLKVAPNATGVQRTAGSYCFNNAAAVGTLVQNNAVICDATNAANSWKQLSNTTLVF